MNLKLQELRFAHHDLVYSVGQALQVSQRISASQLKIPLNVQFNGQLIMSRSPAKREARIGKMNIFVIGPLPSEVERVRDEWNLWLRANKDRIRNLKKAAEGDARSIGNSAARLADLLAARVDELGNRGKVTARNLASVMVLLEEGKKKVLLTGDGHWEDILKGLEHHKMFDANGRFHLDVLKVQHHGSENNYKVDMAERITADHYCVLRQWQARQSRYAGGEAHLRVPPQGSPQDTFTLWFNCESELAPAGKPRTYMKKVKKEVDDQIAASPGKIKVKYLDKSFFDLTI